MTTTFLDVALAGWRGAAARFSDQVYNTVSWQGELTLMVFRGRNVFANRSRRFGLLLSAIGLTLGSVSSAVGQICSSCEYRYLTSGMARIELADPEGRWSAEGLEIDLRDPRVELDTAIAERSVLGRETISQIALRTEEPKRWLAALVGCDFPAERGLPQGLLIQNGEILSAPGGNPSFLVTRNGTPTIGLFEWDMRLELPAGDEIPIDCFNRQPDSGQVALFTPHYGVRTGTAGGVTEVELHLFDSYLNPTGGTVVKVGDAFPGLGNQVIPRFGYILTLPHDLYEKYVQHLGIGIGAKLHCRIFADDVPGAIQSELALPKEGPAWPSRIGWAVSAGPRILREGEISLETAHENVAPEVGLGGSQTALGVNPALGRLWLVLVKAQSADRVDLLDVARCLVLLGASDGMALAGGDRSPFRIRDRVLNPPVSSRLEVPIADALLLYSGTARPGFAGLEIDPSVSFMPTHGEIEFSVAAYDKAGWKVPLATDQVEVELVSNLGRLEGFKFIAGGDEGTADLIFRATGTSGTSFTHAGQRVTVSIRQPEQLAIIPSPVILDPGEREDLIVELLDEEGNALRFPTEEVEWNLKGCEGLLSPQGALITSTTGSGMVEARYRRWRGEAPVYVGLLRAVEFTSLREVDDWMTAYQMMKGAECDLEALEKPLANAPATMLHYTLPDMEGAQVTLGRRLPVNGHPYGFRIRVYGDGSGHKLRCLVEDRSGYLYQVGFRQPITWRDSWREIDASLELVQQMSGKQRARPRFPITFVGLALSRGTDRPAGSGAIGLGPLELLYMHSR